MKVLHIISKFGGGGLERRAIQTVKGLTSQKGLEQLIVVYSDQIEYREVLSLGVEIHYMQKKDRLGRSKELKSIIATCRPDVVHSWLDRFPTELIVLSLLKRKYGYKYIHGSVCDGNKIPVLTPLWLCQRFSFYNADAIVSNSKAGLLAKGAPQNKSFVNYNGFDFERIPKTIKPQKRAELGVTTRYMVTMCGRVDGSKDWIAYLGVAALAKDDGMDATFVAIGNGVLLDDYSNRTVEKSLDNVKFVGRRSDVEEIIGLSDVCMLLSANDKHAEGVSNFILESMASGKPVIATRGGGTPEIIDDGITGFVVDDNVHEAYNRLLELINDDEKRNMFGIESFRTIQSRFSLDLMTQNYVSLYQKLLSEINR